MRATPTVWAGALAALGLWIPCACGPAAPRRPAVSGEAPGDRPLGAADHLRLAETLERAGQWGAAVFHYRMALGLTRAAALRRSIEDRIRECRDRGGLSGPPRLRTSTDAGAWAMGDARPVRIAGGLFLQGSSATERRMAVLLCLTRLAVRGKRDPRCDLQTRDERPEGSGSVPTFLLDRVEVSWDRYQACVRAGACAPPPARFGPPKELRLPVVGVTAAEAASYCRHVGGRLPTDSEWERAGRGHQAPARPWPWGFHAMERCAVHGLPSGAPRSEGPAPAGATRCDASWEGVLDLAGNVREWVSLDAPRSPDGPRAVGPTGPGAALGHSNPHPVRGGSYRLPEWAGRVGARTLEAPDFRGDDVGFRCARAR